MLSDIASHKKTNTMILFIRGRVKSIETESRLRITRGWVEREMRSDYLICTGCCTEVMKILKPDNIVNILNTIEMYNLKWLIICFVRFFFKFILEYS